MNLFIPYWSHYVTAEACASTQLWHSSRKYYKTKS